MGCDYYGADCSYIDEDGVHNWAPDSARLYFSDDTQCLCTWPYLEHLCASELRSLAYLGAAVVLAHHGKLEATYLPLPNSLPAEIVNFINDSIPEHKHV